MFYDFGYEEEGRLQKTYDMKLLRRLYRFVRPYGRGFVWAAVIALIVIALELAVPHVTRYAVDRFIVPQADTDSGKDGDGLIRLSAAPADLDRERARHPDWKPTADGKAVQIPAAELKTLDRSEIAALRQDHLTGVALSALIYMGLVAGIFVLTYFQTMILERAGQGIMHDLRMHLFAHIQSQSVAYFTRHPTARLVTRATNDIQNMQELFTSVVVMVFKDILLLSGIAVTMLTLHVRLALICFTVLPFVLAATFFFAQAAREVFRRLRILTADINTRFSETITGMRVIQLFLKEAENLSRFDTVNQAFYVAGLRQVHVFDVFMPVIEFLGALSLGMLIYFGGRGVIGGDLSLGILVAFIAYMRMFFQPIRDMSEKYNILQNAMSSAERIFQILDTREALPQPVASGEPIGRIAHIALDRVSLSYLTDEPVLRDISFTVEKGQSVALVGPTGSGKTSIIHLIVRFYDPTSGAVRFNQRDIRSWPPRHLRARMALVTQDPFLFSGTIRDNICVGRITPPDMEAIVRAARLGPILARLPDSLDTRLSEGGASLSSGERQLICIARALAIDPDLILLDEATSYIDSETEQAIQAALGELMAGRTAVIVAHRLSTARGAHRIHVLDQGRIIESGTHDELMALKGFYHQLYAIQESGEGMGETAGAACERFGLGAGNVDQITAECKSDD